MFASRISRIVLVVSVIVGIAAVFIIPPPLYFQFGRFTAGLPQQYFAFDPDRYLAAVPQRSGLAIALIAAAKFVVGVLVVWVFYGIARFISGGRSRPSSSAS
jgi:hypothetical protein